MERILRFRESDSYHLLPHSDVTSEKTEHSSASLSTAFRKFIFLVFFIIFIILLTEVWYNHNNNLIRSKCDTVLDECVGVPLNDTVLPPYVDYLQPHVISPKYGITQCMIPKVMTTISSAALCYLSNSTNFALQHRKISTESYYTRLCPELGKRTFDEVRPFIRDPKNYIIMLRNPYTRFVSGFVEKCVNKDDPKNCYGCGSDIRCFLETQFKIFKNIQTAPRYNMTDTHFAPQTWYCQMQKMFGNATVIRYGETQIERDEMIDGYVAVFKNANVPEDEIAEVRKEFSVGKSYHTTTGTDIRKYYDDLIRNDLVIRRAIQRFYYWDFKILGYKI